MEIGDGVGVTVISVIGTVLRLESHLGAFLPLPVVLAGARWDSKVAAKTLTVTAILVSILTGWQRALTYVLMHGAMGITLAVLWHQGATWGVTVPVASLVRSLGIMASLAVASFLLREDILAMVAAQMCLLLEQIAGAMGASGTPSLFWVYLLIFGVVLLNSVSYVILIHVLYFILLRNIAAPGFCKAPRFVARFF